MPEMDYVPFMQAALKLGRRGRFHTWPNPAVGAVLLNRKSEIVAAGWHHAAGGPHAEIECLQDAKRRGVDPAGMTMVVTLEPCNHHGKTPPCANALIEAHIATVVYGTRDPTREAGGGAQTLLENGINVVGPVLEQECRDLIADFIIWNTTKRPYVILKLASTLDGRIATRTGHSRWISGEASRQKVHRLREDIARFGGAILIGGGTFRADNPELTARPDDHDSAAQPLACILTSRLPKPEANFKLLKERREQTIFFASPAAAASTTAEALRKAGCRVFSIGPSRNGEADLPLMFETMREEMHIPYVLCEGGGSLGRTLLEAGFADEFHLHIAPLIMGDNNARPLFDGSSPLSLDETLKMRFCSSGMCGQDLHVVLRPAPAGGN